MSVRTWMQRGLLAAGTVAVLQGATPAHAAEKTTITMPVVQSESEDFSRMRGVLTAMVGPGVTDGLSRDREGTHREVHAVKREGSHLVNWEVKFRAGAQPGHMQMMCESVQGSALALCGDIQKSYKESISR